jgi:hypothetical protein
MDCVDCVAGNVQLAATDADGMADVADGCWLMAEGYGRWSFHPP